MSDAKRDVDPSGISKPYIIASHKEVSLALVQSGLVFIVSQNGVSITVAYTDMSDMVDLACQYLSQHNIKNANDM